MKPWINDTIQPARPSYNKYPPHEPTEEWREVVQILHANGIPIRIIGRCLNTSAAVVRRLYRRELRDAHWQVEATMVSALVYAAKRGNWGAARYWLMVHSRNPKWRVAHAEAAAAEGNAPSNNTTITIRGGLPEGEIDELDEAPDLRPNGANGTGTDPSH